MTIRCLLPALLLAVFAAGPAWAERAAGLTGDAGLVEFDTSTPEQGSVRLITGLETSSEVVIGLDVRPVSGRLYISTVPNGITSNATIRTYLLDPASANATLVGTLPGTVSGAGDQPTGYDFNPRGDRIRVVGANNANFRVNPDNGSLTNSDTNLSAGPITAVAYDRNFPSGDLTSSQTTLYALNSN